MGKDLPAATELQASSAEWEWSISTFLLSPASPLPYSHELQPSRPGSNGEDLGALSKLNRSLPELPGWLAATLLMPACSSITTVFVNLFISD